MIIAREQACADKYSYTSNVKLIIKLGLDLLLSAAPIESHVAALVVSH